MFDSKRRVLLITFVITIGLMQPVFAGKKKKKGPQPNTSSSASSSSQASPDTQKNDAQVINEKLEDCRKVLDELGGEKEVCSTQPKDHIDEREKKLLDRKAVLCSGKRSAKKFCNEFYNSMSASTLVSAAGTAIGTYCVRFILDAEASKNMISAYSLQSSISGVATGAIQGVLNGWQRCTMTPEDGLKELYKESMKNSEALLPKLPPHLKNLIEKLDRDTEPSLKPKLQYDMTDKYDYLMKQLTLRELVYLPLAWAPKDISENSPTLTSQDKQDLHHEIRKILDDYPQHEAGLQVLIDRIRQNSSSEVEKPKRIQFFLYGEAGTGKTTLVRRLAKATKHYVCEISAKDLSPIELLGTPSSPNESNLNLPKALGKLGECFRRAGHSDFFLLIDELGDLIGEDDRDEKFQESDQTKVLKAQAKVLTDPGLKELTLALEGLKVDFSRVIVVGTGNKVSRSQSIIERMPPFYLDKLEPGQKVTALHDGYRDAFRTLKKQVTPEQLLAIKTVSDEYLKLIFEEDRKRFKGGRVIKDVVDEFVTYIKGSVVNGRQTSDEQRRKFIVDSFQRRVVSDPSKK